MAQELFLSVQQAEEQADHTVQSAQLKARELIKETEAKIKAEDRIAALAHRAQYQSILDDKRKAVERSLEEQRPQVLAAQRESLDLARAKIDRVAQIIFERIWTDGNR